MDAVTQAQQQMAQYAPQAQSQTQQFSMGAGLGAGMSNPLSQGIQHFSNLFNSLYGNNTGQDGNATPITYPGAQSQGMYQPQNIQSLLQQLMQSGQFSFNDQGQQYQPGAQGPQMMPGGAMDQTWQGLQRQGNAFNQQIPPTQVPWNNTNGAYGATLWATPMSGEDGSML